MPQDNYPRFRTAHDAGKYIAAQAYPYARTLEPHDFGAVDRYKENPAWDYAQFEVVPYGDGEYMIVDRLNEIEQKTSQEWYFEYQARGYTIVIASGWDDKLDQDWYEFFYHTPITREEFEKRLHSSVVDFYTK